MRFTVMTYNVHSCIGTDGKISPQRVAAVIARSNPDIVGLQELDAGLSRTGRVHQAQEIARLLRMDYRFHPSLQVEEGGYGNAVLSRFPIRLVKAGKLPAPEGRGDLEERGALWVEVVLPHLRLNVIFTHLGLDRGERLVQAGQLLGGEWLASPECRSPVVFGGDLNAISGSTVHRLFRDSFLDAAERRARRRPLRTWPSRYPFVGIDHLFVSRDIVVRGVSVPSTPAARTASDHLPLVAELLVV
jgi:endonuclease/exonuclease/phosphatase family metal-dependent hydrolase